ncbi:MAG: aldo/keto reductase, partial [Chloroflexia bacterium]|nr:aldo/keto reductase [Chloroflexia bacterium]
GKCLHQLDVNPDDILISNKLGWVRKQLTTSEPTFEPGVWHNLKFDAEQKIGYDGILECWDQGNELLGGRYIPQLLSVHDPDEYLALANDEQAEGKLLNNILDAYQALSDLKKQGKAKAIGVGAKNWRTIELISRHVKLDWVMLANSYTIMNHPPELLKFIEALNKKHIKIINSAVFHGGFLTGSSYFDYKPVNIESHPSLFHWREEFNTICKKHDIKPSDACISFGMSGPGVIAISLNTSNPERIKDNVNSVLTKLPREFYIDMVNAGLISNNYLNIALEK